MTMWEVRILDGEREILEKRRNSWKWRKFI